MAPGLVQRMKSIVVGGSPSAMTQGEDAQPVTVTDPLDDSAADPRGTEPDADAPRTPDSDPPELANPPEGTSVRPYVPARAADAPATPEPALVDSVPPLLEPAQQIPAGPALPGDPSELACFGERGRLQPVPGRLTAQPGEALANVPDTAIEWVDQTDPNDPDQTLALRGVSVRGHIHRWEGSVRQDQLAVGQVGENWVAAVSDGLGSQPHSHLGAALASRFVAGWSSAEQLVRSEQTVFSCAEVASIMRFEARQRGLDPRAVSATLTFAVVPARPDVDENGYPRWRVAVAQIGDSHAYLLRDGEWNRITEGDPETEADGALTNVVDPLPGHTDAQVWHLDAEPGDVLALTSDGVGTMLEDLPSFAAAMAGQWEPYAPSPAALLYVVDAAARSYDDDRTFIGIKFGAQ